MKMRDFGRIQTSNLNLQHVISEIPELVRNNEGVLILGEPGVGRRVVAQMIHEASAYAHTHMICYRNVTDKTKNVIVLVSEIQFLNFSAQEILLEKMRMNKGNCFWIATAQSDFLQLIQRGLFRKDLLSEFSKQVFIPNLQQRKSDIPYLAEQILITLSWVTGRFLRLSRNATDRLLAHSWSENIRELEQVLESAALNAKGSIIEAEDLPLIFTQEQAAHQISTLAEMEKKLIMQTLQITQNNKSQAARILGISIRTLRNKLSLYRSKSADTFQEEAMHESNV